MQYSTFALALLASAAMAGRYGHGSGHGFSYGSGHGSYPSHGNSHSHHSHGYQKNPWTHTVENYTTTNGYHRDPFTARQEDGTTNSDREGWYGPYQRFSPTQLQYVPSVSCSTFALCEFRGNFAGDQIQIAQLKGKAPVVKREFCTSNNAGFNNGLAGGGQQYSLEVRQYGKIGNGCADTGDVYNPQLEVDKYGRPNPYQDSRKGTISNFTSELCDATNPTTSNYGFVDSEPISLLQNLEGPENILGRSIVLRSADGTIQDCCVISRAREPIGYGPKPVNWPTGRQSYNYSSYGTNIAVPLPYHKHGYQVTADANDYHHSPHYSGSYYGGSSYGGYHH